MADDSGHIHFLRESSCVGPMYLNIEVDGRDCAKLRKGGEKSVRVAPGKHRIKVRPWSGTTEPRTTEIEVGAQQNTDIVVRCNKPLSFFAKMTISIAATPWRGLVRIDTQTPLERMVDWGKYSFAVTETGLTSEHAGETTHIEDNSKSDVSSTHKLLVENEWARTILVGGETQQTRGFSAGLGVGWVTVAVKAENEISSKFAIQQGERKRVSQQVEVNVPARTTVTMVVHWKFVWRNGSVRIAGPTGTVDVPFRFVHSLDFDRYTISS